MVQQKGLWVLILCVLTLFSCSDSTTSLPNDTGKISTSLDLEKPERRGRSSGGGSRRRSRSSGGQDSQPNEPVPVCDRTEAIKLAILEKLKELECSEITIGQLTDNSLHLLNRELTELKVGDFDGFVSLELLYLQDNDLEGTLPEKLFRGLTVLRELYISGNLLTNLPQRLFNGLETLEFLGLSDNRLNALHRDIFDGLVNLEWLNLENNQLKTLPPGLFDELTSLQRLYLTGNQLKTLPPGLFDELTSLTRLYIYDNDLETLPEGLFNNLTNLQTLYIHGNEFSEGEKERIKGELEAAGLDLEVLDLTI